VALNSLQCADVPLRNCSLTHSLTHSNQTNTVKVLTVPQSADVNHGKLKPSTGSLILLCSTIRLLREVTLHPFASSPMPTLHSVSKNVPPLACYTFERILILFGRNVTDKVGNQKTLYYATLSNLCFCTTWQNGETQKSHFHSAGLCYTQCTCALSSSKKKLSSAMCLIASNIC